MPMPSYDTVDAYLADQRDEVRVILERVRAIVRKAGPKLEESISYKVPTYKLGDTPVVFFAAWKAHYSMYPATAVVFAAVPELLPMKHAKDTVRFDYSASVPSGLITKLLKARLKEVSAEPKARKKR